MSPTGRRTAWPALSVALLAFLGASCSLEPDGPIPETRITRIQAFYCAATNLPTCQIRGNPIPDGTLPPTDVPFMVWVWHPGSNTTLWRLLSSLDTGEPPTEQLGIDSIGLWFHLQGAPAKTYTVRVDIRGLSGILATDSLRWGFP